MQQTTIVTGIITHVGPTGLITPSAVFEPIRDGNRTVKQATLHNMTFIENRLGGISIGDQVLVNIENGHAEIQRVIRHNPKKEFRIEECPICHSKAVYGTDENGNGANMYCSNPECPIVIQGRFLHWCGKSAMDIPGIGPGMIRKLIAVTHIKCPYELYDLSKETFVQMFGRKKGANFYDKIQDSKHADISRLIAGLDIPYVGLHIGKILAKAYPTMDDVLIAAKGNKLAEIPNIGPITSECLHYFMAMPYGQNLLQEYKVRGLNWTSLSYVQ